jgi:hypothetical protein
VLTQIADWMEFDGRTVDHWRCAYLLEWRLDGTVLFLGPVARVVASVAPKSKYWASGQDGQRLRPHETPCFAFIDVVPFLG